jgi:hypothetical protein
MLIISLENGHSTPATPFSPRMKGNRHGAQGRRHARHRIAPNPENVDFFFELKMNGAAHEIL